MAQAALRHMMFTLATAGVLMGCVEGSGTGSGTTSAPAVPAKSGTGADIEAPEVFQTTDSALWDGRPSLGGIWVASPNATDPERVVMFNPATGKSVTGALFRRERDNPGPTLQMSSDAAEALGMLAGQPTQIQVTALRREVVKEAAAPEPEIADDADSSEAAATAAATTAALAAADSVGETLSPEPDKAKDPETAALPDGAEPATAEPAAEEPPARKTWKERRAEAKAAREAKKAAAATAAAASMEPAASAEGAGVVAVETAPIDAGSAPIPATVAAEPVAKPEPVKTRRQQRAEEAAAAAEASATEAPTAAVAAGRSIMVASFSKEENAARAVEALAKIGVSAQPRKSETNGKVVWGVVALGDEAMLASIKAAGFADAYFLK